jgi:hypothetical protein
MPQRNEVLLQLKPIGASALYPPELSGSGIGESGEAHI